MRRYAMSLVAAGFAAPVVALAASRRDAVVTATAVALAAWAGVELFVGLFRAYEGVVPSGRAVQVSRMVWLASAILAALDVGLGWTLAAPPVAVTGGAAALALSGVLLRLWAVVHLGGSFTYDVRRPAGGALVTTGPYRLVRHPAYLGLALVSTLPALALGSLGGFLGLAASTAVATVHRARAEDAMLEREFGEAFRDYARRTARLVPFVGW